MVLFRNIKAEDGSGLSAILVFITIIVLLLGLVLGVYQFRIKSVKEDGQRLKAYYNAQSGLQKALEMLNDNPNWKGGKTVLYPSDTVSVWLSAVKRGGFTQWKSTAYIGKQRAKWVGIFGTAAPEWTDAAFISGDDRTQWTLAGNTQINGTAYLPSGYWNEQVLPSDNRSPAVHNGKVESLYRNNSPKIVSKDLDAQFDELLEIPTHVTWQNESLINTSSLTNLSNVYFNQNVWIKPDSLFHFKDPIYWFINGNLVVENEIVFESGATIICTGEIVVKGNLKGNDIWLVSEKSVEVNGGEFFGQIWAKERIGIENTALKYPSFVYLKGYERNRKRYGEIDIGENVHIDGTILYPPNQSRQDDVGFIRFGQKSKIRGVVLNYGRSEGDVQIAGTFLTFGFSFYESPQYYLNWLRDVNIAVKLRPEPFDMPLLFAEKRPYKLIAAYEE